MVQQKLKSVVKLWQEVGKMIDEKKLIDELKQSGMIFDNEYGNSVVDMIENQTKFCGWIPCSERLPKRNREYVCTQEIYSLSNGKMIGKSVKMVEFCNGEWKQAKHLKVIAWQPLPDTYIENQKD